MYTKEQVKAIKKEFWTAFGIYMKKNNTKVFKKKRWVNYKTGINDLYFRLDFTDKKAFFSIDIQHKDDGIRELYYEQFLEFKKMLNSMFDDKLTWQPVAFDKFNNPKACIFEELQNVSIYNKSDWAETMRFLEERIVTINEFWGEFKEVFKQLD